MKSFFKVAIIFIFSIANVSLFGAYKLPKPPNVIVILTDDQGIGDLACQGNPWIKTPHIDSFYKQSVRFTDFHVSPLCAPTRGAIMTGRYPINNGIWATYKGRDLLSEGAPTMSTVFKKNGYKTGIFGKWHLGDNYPTRPTDSGFDVVVQHKAGGVGELSDYWGNSYFDDMYYVNNQPKQFEGYCTDVWFDETMKFIDQNKETPFFVYLPTNAPHSPLIVDPKYAAPYQYLEGTKIPSANFYGMIANIDENFGKLETFLKDKNLLENTIVIFMTDNGSGTGVSKDGKLGYNKGFRGKKGFKTEGGHRVPFFIRWPNGNIQGGKDIDDLTAHIDLLPTLASLCDLELPKDLKLDGVDFSCLFKNKKEKLNDRTLFIHHRQDWRPPKDEDETCLMKGKWRLVNGKALYNVEQDAFQKNDVAKEYPKIVKSFLNDNQRFLKIAKTGSEYQQFPVNVIGNKQQKTIKLTIQHAIGEDKGIWKAEQVAAGMKNTNNTHAIKVDKAGVYKISCRRWPKECSGPILGIPKENPKNLFTYKTISPQKVRIQLANQMLEKEIQENQEEVVFRVFLEKGKTLLVTDFIERTKKYGVYYTYIELVQ
ncbi:arylsulfatase [Wenyingzhuangia aestuarii]|uniref:arylsulfatase n=1 Tax=Wenyingzhuangia aestuarii TaxID=1647582 RepID=UPI0014397E90|nr:arylsulfatase [Wenyingzhuangia aestuarii]NJB83518.1 arylsulfatase A-like enzyme [Wenyingzhuangia aestuarii]